jgi:alkylhydroperoxidase family enzyme
MRQGLDEEKICELDLPEARQTFSPREKLAIRFAEKMALDHRSIDEAFVGELRSEFADAEIVELGMMIGQYIGFGRLLVALGIDREAAEPYLAGAGGRR